MRRAPSQFAHIFRDPDYSLLQRRKLISGMSKYRLWLIPTEFTMLELSQWHEENPDHQLPWMVELGDGPTDLRFRLMETSERLKWCAEALSGRLPSLN